MIDKAGNAGNIMAIDTIVGYHSHNYPNPFSPGQPGEGKGSTNLVFYLTADQAEQEVMVYIYDLFGNLVNKWRVTSPRAGINDGGESADSTLKWYGLNQDQKFVADGGYICVIKAGDEILSRHKIAVAK
jgi:flagellar hook assembly protein FlgD